MTSPRLNAAKVREDVALTTRICDGYQPTEGCPPLSSHWDGSPLSGSQWLRGFAERIARESVTAEAWKKLEQITRKDDVSYLIELVYLYTVRQKTRVEAGRESHRVLKVALDSIVPAYDKLIHNLAAMNKSRKAAHALTYESFAEELRSLVAGRMHAEKVREDAAYWGSDKTDAREWYLFMMASTVKRVAGEQEVEVLLSLIDAAVGAHGEKTGLLQAETLSKRIQRSRQRVNSRSSLATTPSSVQTHNEDDPIPF